MDVLDIHSATAQQQAQTNLFLQIQLQRPDDRKWYDREEKVDKGERTCTNISMSE
jgi:hypothetical protein